MVSINASDKQIEIALKTNDVFSSQDDIMDDLPRSMLLNSPPINKSSKKFDSRINLTDERKQVQLASQLEIQAKVITYQMP